MVLALRLVVEPRRATEAGLDPAPAEGGRQALAAAPAGARLDWPGVGLSCAGLFCLTLALIQANTWGWTSAAVLSLIAVAAVFAGGFVAPVICAAPSPSLTCDSSAIVPSPLPAPPS